MPALCISSPRSYSSTCVYLMLTYYPPVSVSQKYILDTYDISNNMNKMKSSQVTTIINIIIIFSISTISPITTISIFTFTCSLPAHEVPDRALCPPRDLPLPLSTDLLLLLLLDVSDAPFTLLVSQEALVLL